MAEEGKLDPVVGREMEIERVIQIFEPPHEKYPALIVARGWQDAIIEGLAQRIINRETPETLLDKRVFAA